MRNSGPSALHQCLPPSPLQTQVHQSFVLSNATEKDITLQILTRGHIVDRAGVLDATRLHANTQTVPLPVISTFTKAALNFPPHSEALSPPPNSELPLHQLRPLLGKRLQLPLVILLLRLHPHLVQLGVSPPPPLNLEQRLPLLVAAALHLELLNKHLPWAGALDKHRRGLRRQLQTLMASRLD